MDDGTVGAQDTSVLDNAFVLIDAFSPADLSPMSVFSSVFSVGSQHRKPGHFVPALALPPVTTRCTPR